MNTIIKQAMKANRYYKKAKNFKEFWQEFNDMIDWSYSKKMSKILDLKWDEIDEVEVLNSYNSYNDSSCVTFLMHECVYNEEQFLAFAFHLGGDVRGNYGDLIFIQKSKDEIFDYLLEFKFEFEGYGFSWEMDAFVGEMGYIYNARSLRNSTDYNEKLSKLEGSYIDRYPKGFQTSFQKTLP